PSKLPTFTVLPSFSTISLIVPVKDDGTSAFTLSVITSTKGSYSLTKSPSFTNHVLIVPSVTLSPNWGIIIFSSAIRISPFKIHLIFDYVFRFFPLTSYLPFLSWPHNDYN